MNVGAVLAKIICLSVSGRTNNCSLDLPSIESALAAGLLIPINKNANPAPAYANKDNGIGSSTSENNILGSTNSSTIAIITSKNVPHKALSKYPEEENRRRNSLAIRAENTELARTLSDLYLLPADFKDNASCTRS